MIAEKPEVHLECRADFPLLNPSSGEKSLVYLDSGATTQKPQCVIDALQHYYTYDNANVHRGVYALSERATTAYEAVRQKVCQFIHAAEEKEIIFTSGTTESINLVASTYGQLGVKAGDEILISTMEHHSNIVPWQMLCERTGALLKVTPMEEDGTLNLEAYANQLTEKTKLVAVTHVSNVLGTINPVKHMTALAHEKGIPVLLDGAQAVLHQAVDVQDLDCDFYVFSAHKLYGPTGVGVLYGKKRLLEAMPPYQSGGDMIRRVEFEKTEYNDLPYKFEAGTPNIAGVVGLGAAIDYLQGLTFSAIAAHEKALLDYATDALSALPGLRIVGTAAEKAAVISFVMSQAHPHDIATVLDTEGLAVRAGHHCAMPLMKRLGLPATVRPSFGVYNTYSDVDRLVSALGQVIQLFGEG